MNSSQAKLYKRDQIRTIPVSTTINSNKYSSASLANETCKGTNLTLRNRLVELQKRSDSWRIKVTIDSTNYGRRYTQDAYGKPLDPSPRIIVLHETVYSLISAINTFQTPHYRDEDQVSYHSLVGLDGKVYDIVDPLKRAYGAGHSAYLGEMAITNSKLKGSVNNFALHISLETPLSGANNYANHTGYTDEQYDSLSIILSEWMDTFNLTYSALTTHRRVDLSGERSDPRSFDWSMLMVRLRAISASCNRKF